MAVSKWLTHPRSRRACLPRMTALPRLVKDGDLLSPRRSRGRRATRRRELSAYALPVERSDHQSTMAQPGHGATNGTPHTAERCTRVKAATHERRDRDRKCLGKRFPSLLADTILERSWVVNREEPAVTVQSSQHGKFPLVRSTPIDSLLVLVIRSAARKCRITFSQHGRPYTPHAYRASYVQRSRRGSS
jgi:hypothetical protein